MTYALARKAGLPAQIAKQIAWANYHTDTVKRAALYGVQTQIKSHPLGNWSDRQIQHTVIVPFHFVPGDDPKLPWKCTRNSKRVRHLVEESILCSFQFGIALHALQDSFSHENFSGWREGLNSCWPWDPRSILPNIGHTEMGREPDIAHRVWTDPRSEQRIDNKLRVLGAAQATYEFMACSSEAEPWDDVLQAVTPLLHKSYDERKDGLRKLAGNGVLSYRQLNSDFENRHRRAFIQASRKYLALAFDCFP